MEGLLANLCQLGNLQVSVCVHVCLVACHVYQCRPPVLSTNAVYLYRLPVLSTCAVYLCRLPVLSTCAVYPCCLPMLSTCGMCCLPMLSTCAGYLCWLPVLSTCAVYLCWLPVLLTCAVSKCVYLCYIPLQLHLKDIIAYVVQLFPSTGTVAHRAANTNTMLRLCNTDAPVCLSCLQFMSVAVYEITTQS